MNPRDTDLPESFAVCALVAAPVIAAIVGIVAWVVA